MNRIKATLIHFSITIVVICVLAVFVRCFLYPDYFFNLSGGAKLLSIFIFVNVIIGPLLTLIIFNQKSRKALIFDITVIILLQLSALGYGLYTIWVARPVYNVFVIDRFVIVRSIDLEKNNLEKADPPYNQLPCLAGPKLVFASVPKDPDEQLSLALSGMAGYDLEFFPQYYTDYFVQKEQVIEKAIPLAMLREKSEGAAQKVDEFLRKQKRENEDYYYLPIKGVKTDFMSMIVTRNGDPIIVLPIDPW